jgi:hypothetical protein
MLTPYVRNKDTESPIESFRHNGKIYHHVIFCSDDDRVELKDDEGKCLLIFDAKCGIHLPDHKTQIGQVSMRDDVWFSIIEGQPELRHQNNLKLEVMISKQYLDAQNVD